MSDGLRGWVRRWPIGRVLLALVALVVFVVEWWRWIVAAFLLAAALLALAIVWVWRRRRRRRG